MAPLRYQELLSLWNSKRDGRTYPGRADFDVLELRSWLGDLELVDVERSTDDNYRFKYRLVGTRITEIDGSDVTGRYADDVFPNNLHAVVNSYNAVMTTGEPFLHDATLLPGNDGVYRNYRKLVLPLASDGEKIDMLMILLQEVIDD